MSKEVQPTMFAMMASEMLSERGQTVPFRDFAALMGDKAHVAIRETPVAAEHALLMKCDDPAMEPTINPGDLMLVDMSDTRPRESRVFLVEFGGFTTARRIQVIPGGFNLISDHPAYDPIPVMRDDPDSGVSVIGRVATAWKEVRML